MSVPRGRPEVDNHGRNDAIDQTDVDLSDFGAPMHCILDN
jgi:hypothetical protein